jgi:ribosome recycling factor
MTLDEVMFEAEEKMQKTEDIVCQEFAGVRTSKATPALVDNIVVEVYGGAQMRLKELATITTPEPKVILIQPWDINNLHPIEKAIQKVNLGVNPVIDKKVIRIVLPDLSQERRQELVKLVHKMAEDGRVAIRHVRRDALEHIKALCKAGDITEDEKASAEKDIQKLTDEYIAKIDKHLAAKEKEIMTV